ncbi:MAG: hypothetical protein HYV09_18220 [Deltaproteobacteria bacterium]|nr:hypothetical protein [Deltaproteobacteria bacterium]
MSSNVPKGPLGRLARRVARESGDEGALRAEPRGATSFLASAMDLRGSVDVARALGPAVPSPAPASKREEAEALRARMRARITTVGRGVSTTRVAGLPGVPTFTPVTVLATLRAAEAIEEREGRAVVRATRMLWAPVAAAIARRAARAQTELDTSFTEEAAALAALGGRAAYAIALDALLDRVTDGAIAPLLDRPGELLARRFERILGRELLALPADPRAEDLASWTGQGGWIEQHLSRSESYLRGLVEHRVRRALALVDACCAVESVEKIDPGEGDT